MQTIFWLSTFTLLYTFLGYPLALKCIASLKAAAASGRDARTSGTWFLRRVRHTHQSAPTPSVSIILSAYNEEEIIREKIENFLCLDYPAESLEMVVISDGCTDRTEEIIQSFDCERITLLVQKDRSGKTMAINYGVAEAKGEIVVFTDANSMFDRDAVRKLASHFADPAIGLVSGRSIYMDSNNQAEELGGAYRKYEETIKQHESEVAGIVGADGAIYALRKELYEPLPPEYINDFVHPIQVVLKGHKAINDPQAVCREVIDETHSSALSRQTRIMAQSWLIYATQIGRLLSSLKLVYAWELFSHKFLRWLTIPVMLLLFLTTASLAKQGRFYQVILIAQIFFTLMVFLGSRMKGGVWKAPYMFALLHVASVFGFFKYITGSIYTTWNPRNS